MPETKSKQHEQKARYHGGDPVRDELLPYGSQSVTEEDAGAVKVAARDDWITLGPRIDAFEEVVSEYCGADHAVAFSSGTAALHAAVAHTLPMSELDRINWIYVKRVPEGSGAWGREKNISVHGSHGFTRIKKRHGWKRKRCGTIRVDGGPMRI